jgi:superoxide reductase
VDKADRKGRVKMAVEKRLQVYQCGKCGNIVMVMHVGGGVLTCCDEEMNLLEEKTADAATEKHVPVVEKIDGGFKVTVGSVPHPMEEKHFIEWVELRAGDASYVQFLKPGDAPEAVFRVASGPSDATRPGKVDAAEASAREYCSVHGLWKA